MNIKQFSISLTLLIAMLFATSLANAADYQSEAYQVAYQQYLEVSDDQGGSAKALAKKWQKLVEQNPQDPLALAFLGASHTLMGRDAMMPWSKLSHTEKGLEEMAIAVRLLKPMHQQVMFDHLTVELQVKSTAAIIFTQVPDMFGRHEEGLYLFEEVLSQPEFKQLPAQAVTYLYYFAIAAASQLDEQALLAQWQGRLKQLNVDDEYSAAALALE